MITKEELWNKLGERREKIERAVGKTGPKQPELRIAILSCRDTMLRCAGRSCMWAFQEKEKHFEPYRESELPVRLCAYFGCNGCDTDYETDPSFEKKLERLVLDDVNIIHLSGCLVHHCPNLEKIRTKIEGYGVRCELGTH